MFKLGPSLTKAEKPLPKTVWEKWLKESYEIACGSGPSRKKKAAKKKATKKKATRKQ